jgi:hypothetical protein
VSHCIEQLTVKFPDGCAILNFHGVIQNTIVKNQRKQYAYWNIQVIDSRSYQMSIIHPTLRYVSFMPKKSTPTALYASHKHTKF